MPQKPKSTPELILEAEEAHRQAELTLGLGEAFLQEARETRQKIKKRIRQMVDDGLTEKGCSQT